MIVWWLSQYSSKPPIFASAVPQQFILTLYHWYDAISCSYIAPIKSNISIASENKHMCSANKFYKYFSSISHIFLKYFSNISIASGSKLCVCFRRTKMHGHMCLPDKFYKYFSNIFQVILKYFCCLLVCVCFAWRRMQATHVLSWLVLHVQCPRPLPPQEMHFVQQISQTSTINMSKVFLILSDRCTPLFVWQLG